MMKPRAPIVTVLGHVDHGKTSLLDAIRKTNVASKEVGGITQRIGASQVTTKEGPPGGEAGKKITFIDTPGHAAFSKMRQRGARVADMAILVVAADDGVKPQTLESLSVIKEAGIRFVVAISKVDLASADPEAVLGQLEKEGVLFEGRGGDTPKIEVSAKTGKGIDDLLELISLVSEVNEVKGDSEGSLEAVIIEASKDNRGPVATLVVRNGNLRVGDTIFTENTKGKARALFDDRGRSTTQVLPGEPVQIMGFEDLPLVGARVTKEVQTSDLEEKLGRKKTIGKLKKDEIPILIKAKNSGGLEAVIGSLPRGFVIVAGSIGDVSESDILMAKVSNAYIFAFESAVPHVVQRLADTEGVKVSRFEVIYELIQVLEELVKKGKEEILAKAEILAIFPYENKRVAGCRVLQGKISKTDNLIIKRQDKEIGKVTAASMKKQKQNVNSVGQGEEFGIIFEPQLDFAIGDMLVSLGKQEGTSA